MREVIEMQQDIHMLNSIRRTTQMGSNGIRAVYDEAKNPEFRSALRDQLQEYDRIYAEADSLLQNRQGKPQDINPLAKYGSQLSSKIRVRNSTNATSKIAKMMLQDNTRGMINSMQNIRSMGVLDPKVSSLSKRLLQTTQANIDQMKQFL